MIHRGLVRSPSTNASSLAISLSSNGSDQRYLIIDYRFLVILSRSLYIFLYNDIDFTFFAQAFYGADAKFTIAARCDDHAFFALLAGV